MEINENISNNDKPNKTDKALNLKQTQEEKSIMSKTVLKWAQIWYGVHGGSINPESLIPMQL